MSEIFLSIVFIISVSIINSELEKRKQEEEYRQARIEAELRQLREIQEMNLYD
jgi:hypothetical protein